MGYNHWLFIAIQHPVYRPYGYCSTSHNFFGFEFKCGNGKCYQFGFFNHISIPELPLGKYVSKYGIGRYLKLSLVLMISGLLLSAFSKDINMLLFSRIIQGIATAIINGSIYVIVAVQLPTDKLGYVLGIMSSYGYIGLCLSNTISGMVVYYLSWRVVFLILIPIYVITLLILIKLNKEWNTDDDRETDKIGSLLYALFIGLFLYGLVKLDNNNMIILFISVVILTIFIYFEKNKSNPTYDLELLKIQNMY